MPETNIKKMRKAAGLTQKELAEKSGVKLRMIQAYEQGYKDINGASVVTALNIAKALKCDVKKILNPIE